MQTHPCRLLVILAEGAIEPQLVEDVLRLGAHGYTIVDARRGERNGVRDALWDADRCIRMEILCDPHTCEGLVEHLQTTYFAHYSISLYVCEVGVLRPEKYAA